MRGYVLSYCNMYIYKTVYTVYICSLQYILQLQVTMTYMLIMCKANSTNYLMKD